MLVLARKKNQCIVINDDIEIYVIGISGDQVKLGIKAPKSVSVHRKEIYDSIKSQMLEASQGFSLAKEVEHNVKEQRKKLIPPSE